MVDLNHQKINNRSMCLTGRTSFSDVSYWLGFGACLVMLLLGYASLHERILAISYEIERLKENNAELVETNKALRAEYSVLVNPQSIEAVAKEMGLISANKAEVLILDGEPLHPGPHQVAQTRRQPHILYE